MGGSCTRVLGMWSTPSLRLFPGPLWPGVVVPVRVASMGQIELFNNLLYFGGACGIMVIVVGNGHSDTSSNPGCDWLHFT